MALIGSLATLEDIAAALAASYAAVDAELAAIADEAFGAAPAGVWSPAENLAHLIAVNGAILGGLGSPKPLLLERFGAADRPSRPLAEIRAIYREALASGRAVAPPRFAPAPPAERSRLAADWRDQGGGLAAALSGWSESEADTHLLPHPVLGAMTIREMLRFALYHNQHHANDVRRLLGQQEIEWFAAEDGGR